MEIHSEVLRQLKDFAAWERTGSTEGKLTLFDYVGFVATPDLLFAFAELFCPQLVVHDGLTFLATGFKSEVYDQWVRNGRSRQEIQRVMNHVHVSSLIQNAELDDTLASAIADVIASIWSRTLSEHGLRAERIGGTVEGASVTFYSP